MCVFSSLIYEQTPTFFPFSILFIQSAKAQQINDSIQIPLRLID